MKQGSRRPLALSGCLLVLALCLSLWPQPTAAVRLQLTLADDNMSFGQGRFFRTGLAMEDPPDETGGVQLVTVKQRQGWSTTAALPLPLSSHTSAVYGDRIFVVGGKTYDLETPSSITKSAQFFATRIADLPTGRLRPWTEQPTLPALPVPVSHAASVVVTVAGQPYLFVLGGQIKVGLALDDVTTSRIFYYPITPDADGNLVVYPAWREITSPSQRLPHQPNFGENYGSTARGGGARGMGVATTTINGTPYIYVFGGLNRVYSTAAGYTDKYLSEVRRASISVTGQNLSLSWDSRPVAQIGGGLAVPLEGAAAVTFQHPDTSVKDLGVYLIGGTRCNATCDSAPVRQQEQKAYVAHIKPDGTLDWLPEGSMSLPRSAHDAIQADGQILVLAGRENDSPSLTGAQGFVGADVGERQRTVADDLALYRDPSAPNDTNFDLSEGFLGTAQPRMDHSAETLSGSFYGQYVYMIGGQVQVDASTIKEASNEVWVGNLKTPPIRTDNFVPYGAYYSKLYDFGPNAEYFNLYWKIKLSRDANNAIIPGQRIEMQYRTSNDGQTFSPLSTAVVSSDETNHTIQIPNGTTGRYFQFVATLYRSSTSLQGAPILDKVELEVNRSGFPNLRFAPDNPITIDPVTLTSTISPRVTIANLPYSNEIPLLAANWDSEGSFFVIMYKLGPGQAVPRPNWPTFSDPGIAFAEVSKSSLPECTRRPCAQPTGSQFSIPPTTWRQWCDNPPFCPFATNSYWHSQFAEAGEHKVYVMVDANNTYTWGDVKESDDSGAGESDNVTGPYSVTVLEAMKKVFAPFVANPGTSSAAAAQAPAVKQPWTHTIK